jgi:hypothetical protein
MCHIEAALKFIFLQQPAEPSLEQVAQVQTEFNSALEQHIGDVSLASTTFLVSLFLEANSSG